MIITDTYKNNIKEIEKFLYTFNFSEAEEARIRKYIENPLDVVNDNIKALFAKYDNEVVDYRIQLPSSMIRQRQSIQREIYLIMALVVDCLEEDDKFKFSVDENGKIRPDFQVTTSTIANNYFLIKNDKRKVWKYLDSKVTSIAKRAYARWLEAKSFGYDANSDTAREFIDARGTAIRLGSFLKVMTDYVESLGTRSTSLRTKINKLVSKCNNAIDVTGMEHSEIINLIANEFYKPTFNIIQEIISAKMLDLDKYKLYLSFNVFDWLLASSGEEWHSCIDMQSSYAYGTGLLGMCGCPDWGMLLYTDGNTKTFGGITSYHMVTRSWVCYTNMEDFQMINWYPKDVRDSIEFTDSEDFKFSFERYNSSRKSYSIWDPIAFRNGAVAWIYSDSNCFEITPNKDKVYFTFKDSCGLPRLAKYDCGIRNDDYSLESVIRSITRNYSSIWSAVQDEYQISVSDRSEVVRCDCCGEEVENEDDLTYIESEDISVCRSCLENNYFWCEGCEEYHNYDNSYEVYNGENSWDYTLMCEDCLNSAMRDGNVYWDEIAERYYSGNDYTNVNYDDDVYRLSPSTFRDEVANHHIFEHADGEWYNSEE